MQHQQPDHQAVEDPHHQMPIQYAQYYPQNADASGYGAPAYQDMNYQANMMSAPPELHHLHISGMGLPHPFLPTGVYAPPDNMGTGPHSSPPPSPSIYDTPLSPPISNGSDTSGDNVYLSRNSSGATSPSSSRGSSLVHRNPLRYTPTPSPTSSSGRGRRASLSNSEGEELASSQNQDQSNRKEVTRKQRIEAEQRRRDDLRDGYARIKNVLPVSNSKNSKVMLLERATNHIKALTEENRQMQMRLAVLEQEVARLRELNDRLALGGAAGATPTASGPMSPRDPRPLSPPPEAHSLAEVAGQEIPGEDSDDDDLDI